MQFTNKLQRKKLSKIKSSYVFNNKIQLFLLQSRFLWKILSLCISYTIHKKLLCSSKKSPETWSYLPNPIFFTDFNYACCSLLNSTVSKWIPNIIFLQEFTYKFFCLLVHGQIFAIFIKNHSTLRAMFLFSSSRLWFSLTADAKQKSLKTKNGLHLKAVASMLKRMWYLWPVGDSALSHLNGCFGYFCLEQSVFMWIVHNYLLKIKEYCMQSIY